MPVGDVTDRARSLADRRWHAPKPSKNTCARVNEDGVAVRKERHLRSRVVSEVAEAETTAAVVEKRLAAQAAEQAAHEAPLAPGLSALSSAGPKSCWS